MVNVAADVARRRVHVHISRELPVLVADHGRPRCKRDRRELAERNLGAARRLDQHTREIGQRVAESLLVTHVHRIPLAALDRTSDVLASDCRFDDVLHVADHQAMARDGLAVNRDVREVALRHAFRIDAPRAGHSLKRPLDLPSYSLNLVQVRAEDLDPHRRLDTGQQHVQPIPNGLRPDVWKAWKLQLRIHGGLQ